MHYSDHVLKWVTELLDPEKKSFSFAAMAQQDEADALLVEPNIQDYLPHVKIIVNQLRNFSGKNFPIIFERHYCRGLAKAGGTISIDYATLNKPLSELALTLAHEWGHQSLGHLVNEYCKETSSITENEAEREADYYAGLFLGMYHYEVKEVIKSRLNMPETDPVHGTRFERACIIAQGYEDGLRMQILQIQNQSMPGYEVFKRHTVEAPWNPILRASVKNDQESNARKPAK